MTCKNGLCFSFSLFLTVLCVPSTAYSVTYITEGFVRNIDLNVAYDSNLSDSWLDEDIKGDTILILSAGGAYSLPTGKSGLLVTSGYLGFRVHQEFNELDQRSLSLNTTYYLQFDQGFFAPTYYFGLDYSAYKHAESAERDGQLLKMKLGATKRLDTKLLTHVNFHYLVRKSQDETYETDNQYLSFGLEYRFSSRMTFYSDLEFMQGDIVSNADGATALFRDAVGADAVTRDYLFDCNDTCEMWSYRFEGDAIVSTIGIVFSLAPNLSLDLSVRSYDWQGDAGIGSNDWSGMLGVVWHF